MIWAIIAIWLILLVVFLLLFKGADDDKSDLH